MDIHAVLGDKQLKTKGKVEVISNLLLNEKASLRDLIKIAKLSKGSAKGTCIEAIEFATRTKPEIASMECLKFVTEALLDIAPRV